MLWSADLDQVHIWVHSAFPTLSQSARSQWERPHSFEQSLLESTYNSILLRTGMLSWSGKPAFPSVPDTMATAPTPKVQKVSFGISCIIQEERSRKQPRTQVQADGDGHWQTLGWPCTPHQGYKYPPSVYTAASTLCTPGLHPRVGGWVCISQQPTDCLLQSPVISTLSTRPLFWPTPCIPRGWPGTFYLL